MNEGLEKMIEANRILEQFKGRRMAEFLSVKPIEVSWDWIDALLEAQKLVSSQASREEAFGEVKKIMQEPVPIHESWFKLEAYLRNPHSK